MSQGTGVSITVGEEMPPLDVTLTREQIKAYADASGDFVDLATGKLDGTMAFMSGKLKIKGDMGLAMKLQNILR